MNQRRFEPVPTLLPLTVVADSAYYDVLEVHVEADDGKFPQYIQRRHRTDACPSRALAEIRKAYKKKVSQLP
jgi:hypothetical protein